jgi:hypothetical protein
VGAWLVSVLRTYAILGGAFGKSKERSLALQPHLSF